MKKIFSGFVLAICLVVFAAASGYPATGVPCSETGPQTENVECTSGQTDGQEKSVSPEFAKAAMDLIEIAFVKLADGKTVEAIVTLGKIDVLREQVVLPVLKNAAMSPESKIKTILNAAIDFYGTMIKIACNSSDDEENVTKSVRYDKV